MADAQASTHASLLAELQDRQNTAAWQRYLDRYRPLLVAWSRRYRLQDADVEEVVSAVLLKVVQRMKSGFVYDPSQTYRGWLRRVLESQVSEVLKRKNRPGAQPSGDTDVQEALVQSPAPDETDQVMDELIDLTKAATAAVQTALGKDSVKWRSFELTALEGRKGKEAADLLRISVGTVHQNKSRVARQIRAEVDRRRDAGTNAPGGVP